MESLQNDVPPSPPVSTKVHQESHFEDEINLIDYFRVLWKRKYLIVLGSVLPALMVGLVIFLGPRSYEVTYTYDIELDEKSYKMLLDRFYSAENLDRLTSKLREGGLTKYAQKIAGATTDETLRKLVIFELFPPDFKHGTGGVSVIVTDIEDLEKIQPAKGRLLIMTIVGAPQSSMNGIVSIVRANFEKLIPMYSVKEALNTAIINFKTNMASIEENRVSLKLELERKKATLVKLRNLEPRDPNRILNSTVLERNNVGRNSGYVSLAHQIQAIKSNIIGLEESIRANHKMYDRYKGLLSVNERLFEQVRDKVSSHYTIQEFHAFLTNIASDYEDEELIGYLNAYIKKIENTISINIPIVEEPRVYLVPKGAVKKAAIVFAVLLMITTFAAFLLEGIQKSQAQSS